MNGEKLRTRGETLTADFVERVGRLCREQQQAIDDGLRLVLNL